MIDRDERLVSEEINRLVPVLGKETASKLSKAYLLGDEEVRKRIFELLDVVKAAVLTKEELRDSLLMEPPSKEIAADGDVFIGNVIYGKKNLYPLNMNKQSFLMHIGIFGSSGYGKTNISYCLIRQLSEKGVPVLVFDFSKKNYRDLLATELESRINIYTVGKNTSPFKFNPLKPPEGILLSQWMKEFSSVFDHAYWLLGGGRHVILKALDSAFKAKENPKLFDIKDWLDRYGSANMPARERNWLATAQRPLESLCFKEVGEVFDSEKCISPSDFFSEPGKITILELDALDNSDKSFFIEIILQWIRDWMLVSGSREVLKGVIILEEAHHVLNREKAKKLGSETVIDLIFREIRELGLGMIYIDQHPSLVSYPALGNTSTHIYMNLGLDTQYSSDVHDASSMLGLNYEEQGVYLRKLPVGHGLMLCRNSAFPNPFTVSFNEVKLRKGSVTDENVIEHMKSRNSFIQKSMPSLPKEEPVTQAQNLDKIMNTIQNSEWEIIKILGSGQAAFASRIYRILNVSGTMFKKKVSRLMESGIVGMKVAKIRKNRMNYYFLTGPGEKVFEKAFGKPAKNESIDIDNIVKSLTMGGWRCSVQGSILTIKKAERTLRISLESSLDRKEVLKSIGDFCFLCSSETVKNLVIQKAAKTSAEFSKGITIFASTVQEFEDTGELEQIEFI